ncbi:hypothetical protein HK405_000001 [Cladochytrium tenue]|nr:hypothetical protein HK405_000001 [Cladochytrium tenue]
MAASVMAAIAASHIRRHSLAVTAGDPPAAVPATLRRANGQASRAAAPRVAASRPLPSNTLQLPDLSAYPQSDASNLSQQSQHAGSSTEKQTAESATASSSAPAAKRGFYANDVIERHAERQPHQISLRQLTSFGRTLSREKILVSANYVKDELLVRLARRIHDFQRLPYIVGTNPHVAHAYSLYYDAFDALLSVPQIQTLDDNTAFCELLSTLVDAHMPIVPHLAVGLCEVPASHFGPKETDSFMNVMVFSRIGRRVLAEHHLALTGAFSASVGRGSIHGRDSSAQRQIPDYQNYLNLQSSSPAQVGIVDGRCRASELVQHCGQQAAAWFAETFHDESFPGSAPAAPQVVVDGYHHGLLSCIPSHAEYVLYELMKNAMAHTFRAANPEGYALWRERRLAHQERQRSLEGETSGPKGPEELGRFTWNEPRFAWVPDRSTDDGSVTAESNISLRKGTAAPLPPVQVTIGYLPPGHGRSSEGSSPRAAEVTFRVSDVGGGIPHTLLHDEESGAASSHPSRLADVGPLQRWSTALDRRRRRTAADGADADGSDAGNGASTGDRDEQGEWRPWLRRIHLLRHHIGLGLPMATAFARYWGGEVHLHSMHGFGTDAYYTLPAGEWAENMFWWEGRHRDARGD